MANKLREMRKAKGLTQVALAVKANVPRSVIARHETGRTLLSTKNLSRICKALGCRMEDVLKEDTNGEAS